MPSNAVTIRLQSETLRESRAQALHALLEPDVATKCRLASTIGQTGLLDSHAVYETDGVLPGRPEAPVLVSPSRLKPRGVQTVQGRAVLLHAIAHIEFNAINLALDIVWRFSGLPDAFYRDWMRVAREETAHFVMLREHLQSLGYDYGDFPAHDGLWEMAVKTSDDLLGRLAMVPRTLEARGLDASPPIRQKLQQAGDERGAEILDVILREEIGHVAIGNRWYHWCCVQQGLDSEQAEHMLRQKYSAPRQRGPFNLEARREAGFDESELSRLVQQDS